MELVAQAETVPSSSDAVMTAQPMLQTSGLTKAYAGNVVLRDVSMTILAGEIHALVGENGAGKSTWINLVTGVVRPDAGSISIAGNVAPHLSPRIAEQLGIATVHQELSLCPHLTVGENVFLGKTPTRHGLIDHDRIRHEAERQFRDLGVSIDPNALAGELSLAEQQLVELAKALAAKPKLLILDEATSALDSSQVDLLVQALRRLRDSGTAIVFVSHRMEEIFAISDRITVLKNGEYITTVPAAGTTTADLVRHMVGRDMADIYPPKPAISDLLAGPTLLSVRDLGSGKRFSGVSFELHRGEILGLGGLQGQGQHDLLAALFGLYGLEGGISLHGADLRLRGPRGAMRHRFAYVPEDRKTEGLIVQLPVRENLALPNLDQISQNGVLSRSRERTLVAAMVDKLQIRLRSPRQTLLRLSGGNQQKVAIAKWLPLAPEVYLLAEPTRGIDVGTKQEIYRLMRELTAGGAAIILISSDTIELLGLCDRVLVMYERRPVAMLSGEDVTEENVVHAAVVGEAVGGATVVRISSTATEDPDASVATVASPTVPPRRGVAGMASRLSWLRWLGNLPRAWQDVVPIYGVLLVFAIIYLYLTRNTFGIDTVNNLSAYLFPLFLAAIAQSVIMLTGGIDLAIGQAMSLATVVLATQMYDNPLSMAKAIAIVLIGGGVLGAFTGAIVTLIRLPAIIVTLATSFIWAGWALFVLSVPGGHLPRRFATNFTGQIGGVIPVTLLVLAGAILAWKFVKSTPLGLGIYAVGDNPRGAFVSGVPVRMSRIAAYVIAGVLTGLAGIGLSSYAATGDPLIGAPYSLASISGAVLGGIAFFGGQGQIRGTIAGALTLGLMTQILFISGLSPAYQRIVYGAVLIVALGVKAFASVRIEEGR